MSMIKLITFIVYLVLPANCIFVKNIGHRLIQPNK